MASRAHICFVLLAAHSLAIVAIITNSSTTKTATATSSLAPFRSDTDYVCSCLILASPLIAHHCLAARLDLLHQLVYFCPLISRHSVHATESRSHPHKNHRSSRLEVVLSGAPCQCNATINVSERCYQPPCARVLLVVTAFTRAINFIMSVLCTKPLIGNVILPT